ncbi:hypothetical protein [uncultured Campylobacter sp.]|uniref:hypothetical protein n=1 Tax=uncultured Campylobacter sp. TaxID=218934 RepID=UPI00262543B2|nr:hypothetical protein [uncultured Campylobacter sp.]
MKDIKIPIISGLSLAACLAIAPSQALAGNGVITVTKSDGTPSQLYKSSGENYSGGFESKANAHGQNDNNIVTIRGVTSGGESTWKRTIYGGGNGDGTNLGQGFLYEQVTSANNNILNVNNGATVAILVGGEGKGAQNNTVNLNDAEVHYVVLGGNGTWYGRASNSGDAIHNIVNVSGATKIYYKNFNNFNSTSLMGGRATGTNQANNNEVNISGTPIIVGRVAGAAGPATCAGAWTCLTPLTRSSSVPPERCSDGWGSSCRHVASGPPGWIGWAWVVSRVVSGPTVRRRPVWPWGGWTGWGPREHCVSWWPPPPTARSRWS